MLYCVTVQHALKLLVFKFQPVRFASVCRVTEAELLLQNYGQQSSYNSGANQPKYGAAEAGPGIDQPLSAHVPGGQGVASATEQVLIFCFCKI